MNELQATIRKLALAPLVAFALLCLLCGWWQVVRAPALQSDPNNKRLAENQRRVVPGRLYCADGQLMMGARQVGPSWVRTYPLGEPFGHLTGYNNATGLIPGLSDALTGQGKYADPLAELLNGRPVGCDVTLTINARAQQRATELLRGSRGAVVALDARSGALLCLVSAPGYDPAAVMASPETFAMFRSDPGSPELFRAVQGLYVPGSVFKIFTAAAVLDAGVAKPDDKFHCAGVERVDDTTVTCHVKGGHGKLDFTWALADSCNITFAKLGLKLGAERFAEYLKKFHVLDAARLPLGRGVAQPGRMVQFGPTTRDAELVEASFGQGKTLLTPYGIARLTLAVAHGGEVLEPYIVQEVRTKGGRVLLQGQAQDLGRAVSQGAAEQLAGMMVQTVERGTGRAVGIAGVEVAAKTGSAENPQGRPHAWVSAFAPADNPQFVVTVVVENAGAGGEVAGPIARQVLEALLEK